MSDLNKDKLSSLRNKIRALFSKTTAAGATEAETLAAASLARKLMDQYQIDLGDLAEPEPCTTESVVETKRKRFDIQTSLAVNVARFCRCRVWASNRNKEINFFGRESDTIFASWLSSALTDFVVAKAGHVEADLLLEETAFSYNDYVIGAVTSINSKLKEASAIAPDRNEGGSNALVLCTKALVDREFAKLGLTLHKARSGESHKVRDHNSFQAGKSAGASASINRPIRNTTSTLQLGKS